MTIRTATISDLPAIVAIYNQAIARRGQAGHLVPFTVEERREWFVSFRADEHPLLVAEEEGVVVGYLTLSPYRPGRMAMRHTAEVSYFVDEGHLRRGIGSRLVEEAMALCPGLGIKAVIAIIFETNVASVGLLRKFGFEQWGYLPGVGEFDGVEVGHVYMGRRVAG